jgi:predicted RNA binding protein YcfA (HicA-like mRNA interferase family)
MSKTYSSKEIIIMLKKEGWFQIRITGSHHHFKHEKKPGIVTIPHPRKEIGKGLFNSILKQADLKERGS